MGTVKGVQPITDRAGVSARIAGTALDAVLTSPPHFVVITDRAGTVRGLGNVLPGENEQAAHWYAYVAPDAPQRYLALAALEDGSFCRLGGFPLAEESSTIGDSTDENAPPRSLDQP